MFWLKLLLPLLLLAACSDAVSQPTAVPTALPSLSPSVYLLKPAQVAAPLQRNLDITLNAAQLADQRHDSSLNSELAAEGFSHGARALYGLKENSPAAPFTTVNSDAFLFTTAAGAHQFFRAEARRINSPPAGGTIAKLSEPQTNTDEYAAFTATEVNAQHNTAFVFLARRGRVIVEVYAEGDGAQTVAAQFLPLVQNQEINLAASPDFSS